MAGKQTKRKPEPTGPWYTILADAKAEIANVQAEIATALQRLTAPQQSVQIIEGKIRSGEPFPEYLIPKAGQ